MHKEPVAAYRLRAFYPNYFAVRQVLGEEPLPVAPEGSIPFPEAELEFTDPVDGRPKKVPLDPLDVMILIRYDRTEAARYLRFVLDAFSGEPLAAGEKERIASAYREGLAARFGNASFVENESVVPAYTRHPYDENLLSQKGKVLLDLYREGYPVPDFCVLTSHSYQLSAREREACLGDAIANLERMTGDILGDPDRGLVFAMRSATPYYIPGLMPTYLNVGVTKLVYRSLGQRYGKDVANKIYLNNLQSVCQILGGDQEFYRTVNAGCGCAEGDIEDRIDKLFNRIRRIDEQILYDAMYQARMFMRVAHGFFTRNQDLIYTFQRGHATFPSLILQKMVMTVRNRESYPGVLYSRHPRTGLGMQIESVREIFGEEIMTGTVRADQQEYFDREEIRDEFPAIYHFSPMLPRLEVKLKSPATIEFAVESFEGASLFSILQLNMSELTGRSTLLTAIDLYRKKVITKKNVIQLIRPYHLRQIFSERIDDNSLKNLTFFGSGISVLPRSAVTARIFFSMTKALEAKKKGEKVCLCQEQFIPSETIFMGELDAILSMNPLAIHVVTACLGYGIPAFINLRNHHMDLRDNVLVNDDGLVITEGSWITVSSKHHCIYLGEASYKPARFQKYLEGQKLDMEPKEEKVFINMAQAYHAYQEILSTLRSEEAMTLGDLVKLIRNDYDHDPHKALEFVNGWFDAHHDYYSTEILKSGLGSHNDQHKIYSLLTVDRRVLFFTSIIRICRKEKLSGFTAGAFMLGRFLGQMHPVSFWKHFDAGAIVFMLNEYILFEKYMQVLYEFGERHLSRTRNRILTDDLQTVTLPAMDYEIFIPLKMTAPGWSEVESLLVSGYDRDTLLLVKTLRQPYGKLFHYDQSWSLDKLKTICGEMRVPLPGEAEG